MREDILTGLKNAVERGESLEKAVKTLVTAGYSSAEVNEAAESINLGAIGEISKAEIKQKDEIHPASSQEYNSEIPKYKPLPPAPLVSEQPAEKVPRKIPRWLIFMLIFIGTLIVFIILFSLLGEKILSMFFSSKA